MKGVPFLYLLCCTLYAGIVSGDFGTFTGYANLEKLYTMEDELIYITDVILSHERVMHGNHDAHNLCNVTRVTNAARAIHSDLVTNGSLTEHLSNPVHVVRLIRRLANDWRNVVERLKESEVCEKIMVSKIKTFEDNLPTESQLRNVVVAMLKIQMLYNISADDLLSGNFLGAQTDARLTADDALEVVYTASLAQRHQATATLLQALLTKYAMKGSFDAAGDDDTKETFDRVGALNLLSSAYFKKMKLLYPFLSHNLHPIEKLGRKTDAIDALDELLKIEPDNVGAIRNKDYIVETSKGVPDKPVKSSLATTRQDRRLVELCGGGFTPNVTRQSRLFCTYLPRRHQGMFEKPEVRSEVLSFRPLVMLFHDIVNTSEREAITQLGYKKMTDELFLGQYAHPNGLGSVAIKDPKNARNVTNVKRKMRNIVLSQTHPSDTHLKVRNIGMEGYESDDKLTNFQKKYVLGNFIVFLSNVSEHGGASVFPNAKVKVVPEQGSVLFYESSAIEQFTICPMALGTQWIANYPLFDNFQKKTSDASRLFNPVACLRRQQRFTARK